jgi:tRNA A-37 threonylcarbamoyl transferase component Bud32
LRAPALPPGFESWTFTGGSSAARRDGAAAVRAAVEDAGSLYRWAEAQPGRRAFAGRGAAYGITLGSVPAVVRHARHGGLLAPLLGDLFAGAPRFHREAALSRRLAEGGVRTPALLAGVWYGMGPLHRADVATTQIDGVDLVELFYGDAPPAGAARTAVLEALGALVRRLHDAGFVHPDLQLKNILLRDSGGAGGRPEAWLLDVDTCREIRRDGDADRARNLDRFYRSWSKWNRLREARLTDRDRAVFSAAYLAAEP